MSQSISIVSRILTALLLLLNIARPATGQYMITDLGDLGGGTSIGLGINNAGTVSGACMLPDYSLQAVLYDGLGPHKLATLSPYSRISNAYRLNDAQAAAGDCDVVGAYHAVLWNGSGVHDLGVLPGGRNSTAQALNNAGQVVGYSETGISVHAILYDGHGLRDLGTPAGAFMSMALGINDAGHVVGSSTTAMGVTTAFLYD